ncbi:hypothetical protein BOTNAR_0022g00510 [Botryotinia narcissicola]|uniref:NADH dehydrogenase [ubiquinone] 1 beta subcomplex subunit 9 n=1 Tax=Botryotinia narcissicola TaxID=278944 RepID=A0A4Z1JB06_9HELO|nr:hypothetical protein BOTNAR_0022g00510 [Botryotinia narcissicola]
MSTRSTVSSLYRRSLKLSLDWCALFKETEDLFEKWKHPDPYRPPTAPGGQFSLGWLSSSYAYNVLLPGSKYERNLPSPILDPPAKMALLVPGYFKGRKADGYSAELQSVEEIMNCT